MRNIFQWDLGTRKLELGRRTLLMGIVNVTPDSFSDGGLHFDPARAVEHAICLLDEGADIVDIGGESTRPGSHPTVSASEELGRVVPVIQSVKRQRPEAIVSIDTYKASVAKTAVEAGAEIVNDVSGGTWDADMLPTMAGLKCGYVLMHMRGRPAEWRNLPPVSDPLALVRQELSQRAQEALRHAARDRIVLDPGFGFGKSLDDNYPLLAHFETLHDLGYPLLAGTSRKSFIGRTLGHEARGNPADRLYGTLATETTLALKGAHIIRTHDVRAARDAVRVADEVLQAT